MLNCKNTVHKYVQVLVAENLSFHSVRLLGHNGTSKPVAGHITARTTFKVLSFLGGCLQLEQMLYTLALLTTTSLSLSSLSMVPRNSQRIACSFNRSGSEAGLGVGFSEDTRSLLLPQARLVFFSSFTDTELTGSCWSSSGEAKSGFPANFQEPRVSLPRTSQRRGRSILPTTTPRCFLRRSTSGDPAVVLH